MRRAQSLLAAALKSKIPPRLLPSRRPLSSAVSPAAASPAALPRRQRTLQSQTALQDAFESASTPSSVLAAFTALAPTLPPTSPSLALAHLKVGQILDAAGDPPDQALSHALRALSILDPAPPSVQLAMSLHLAASASYNLHKFSDSLAFLNRAARILSSITPAPDTFDLRPIRHAVHLLLANTKTAMGRREEALVNLNKCLEIKQELLDPGSKELGAAYRDLAEAHAAVLNFDEALKLCRKALEVHELHLGPNSVEVAHDRRLLGVIYTGLEQHELALAENERSQKVLTSWGMEADAMHADVDAANIHIAVGRYDEAVRTLKAVVERTERDSEARALVLVSMAKALCHQEKPDDAKRCLEIACGILGKKEEASASMVSEAYNEVAALYESMNEFETAISLLKRSLAMVERLPEEQHVEGTVLARIGWLLLLTGNVEQAVPYLENAAERMKECFGPKHFGVGYVYNNLGAAYMEMERPQSAAQMFAVAKDVMELSMGPHHRDTVEACQSLANAYKAMGSYPLAMEFQQQVIDAWTSHGPSGKDELRAAKQLLEELKKKSFGTLSDADFDRCLPMLSENNPDFAKMLNQSSADLAKSSQE